MMNHLRIKKLILIVISFFLINTFLYLFYLWASYIDEKTTAGEAYGFVIGDSKKDSYEKASGMLPKLNVGNSSIFIRVTVNDASSSLLGTNSGFTVLTQTLLHDIGFPYFNGKDKWEFYFNGTYFDSLTLTFCDNRLCEIYRHRKNFEIP